MQVASRSSSALAWFGFAVCAAILVLLLSSFFAAGVAGDIVPAWAQAIASFLAFGGIIFVYAGEHARAVSRDLRDAVPLAVAIQYEVFYAGGLCETLTEMRDRKKALPEALMLFLLNRKDLFAVPILAKHIGDLGCFDEDTGRLLGKTLTAAQMLRATIPEDYPPPDVLSDVLEQVFYFGEQLSKWARRCDAKLSQYSKVPPGAIESEVRLPPKTPP